MPRAVIRSSRLRPLVEEWALVLTAAGIEHSIERSGDTIRLEVDGEFADSAQSALRAYDLERLPTGPDDERWREDARPATLAWLTCAAILVGFSLTGPNTPHSFWFSAGAARAAAIRSGELWRCVTALTLHADLLHALSNTFSGLLFLVPLSRLLGGGTSLALTLAAAALATWTNATIRTPGYSGIGASTAVFAALGVLAALRVSGAAVNRGWRRYRAAGAAIGVLAMLGASPTSDVIAHLLGLLAGFAIGYGFARVRTTPLPRYLDHALAAASVLTIAAAWLLATATA